MRSNKDCFGKLHLLGMPKDKIGAVRKGPYFGQITGKPQLGIKLNAAQVECGSHVAVLSEANVLFDISPF